jgi:hypothetical protein
MKTEMAIGIRLRPAHSPDSAATFSSVASKSRFRWISPTHSLCIEQSPSHQVQIRECRRRFEPARVVCQAPVTHLLKAEHPLDHPKHVLNLGAYLGFAAVGLLDRFVNVLTLPVALVGEVLRPWRASANRRPLSSVGLITPNSSLLPMQKQTDGI